jgi:hypothetical protein
MASGGSSLTWASSVPSCLNRNAAGQLRALPEAPVVVNLADVAVIFSLA